MGKLESTIQGKIIKFLEKKGYMVVKQILTNTNGIPDLLVLTGNGKHFWIEVKKEEGEERPLQEYIRRKLTKHGDLSIVVYGYEDFENKFDNRNENNIIGEYLRNSNL